MSADRGAAPTGGVRGHVEPPQLKRGHGCVPATPRNPVYLLVASSPAAVPLIERFCPFSYVGLPVGHPQRQVVIFLLHQQQRQPLRLQREQIDRSRARSAEPGPRGLVEQDQAAVGEQGAADGEHLLLAARELAARCCSALAQAREEAVNTRSSVHALGPRRPAARFSRTDQRGKMRRPWGTRAMPAPHDAVRRPALDRAAFEDHAARAWRGEAHDGADRRWSCPCRCARGWRAPRPGPPGARPVEHVAVAVVGVDVLDVEHAHALTQVDLVTRGSAFTSANVPSVSTSP